MASSGRTNGDLPAPTLALRVREVDPPADHEARRARALSILSQVIARAILERRKARSGGESAAAKPD